MMEDRWGPTGGNDLYSKSKFTVRKERWVKADKLHDTQRELAAVIEERDLLRKGIEAWEVSALGGSPNDLDDAESKLFTHYDKRLFRHINDIMGCACFPDLLERKLFPNAKEITESNATYNAVRWHLPRFSLSDPSNVVVSVGDGHTPRTAALFAFRTAWNAYSVDPMLRPKDWKVARLHTFPMKIEEHFFLFQSPVVIVAVHSHASLTSTLDHIKSPDRALVAMPCCVPVDLKTPPDMCYRDPGIWSEKNEIDRKSVV